MFGLVQNNTPKKTGGLDFSGFLQRINKPNDEGLSFVDRLGLFGAELQDTWGGGDRAPMLQERFDARARSRAQQQAMDQQRQELNAAADELGLKGAKRLQFLTDEGFRRELLTPAKRQYFNTREGIVGTTDNGGLELAYDLPDAPPEVKPIEGPDGIYMPQPDGTYKKVATFGAAPKVFAPQRTGGARPSGSTASSTRRSFGNNPSGPVW